MPDTPKPAAPAAAHTATAASVKTPGRVRAAAHTMPAAAATSGLLSCFLPAATPPASPAGSLLHRKP